MKITIIQLPHFYDGTFRPPTYYPLGIGYLVSVLKREHELIALDLWVDNSSVNEAIKRIKKNVPDIFFVSLYSTQYPYFKELVKALKQEFPNNKIVVGGPGATFSYNVILEKTSVDICVLGEGEITSKELLSNLNNLGNVDGIAYREKDKIVVTKKREQINDLDLLPLPDRSFFDIVRYIEENAKVDGSFKGRRMTNIVAGRGCPYQCTYCSKTFTGARLRSSLKIKEEIFELKREYGIDSLEFNDELFVISKQRAVELCGILKESDLQWGCQGRINLVDEELLKIMKASNCLFIGYGVESYSQSILDKMNKKIKVEQILPVIEMTKKIGLEPIIQYMYGFIGENDETIARTIDFFEKVDHTYVGSFTTPIPGTKIYEYALNKKMITDEEQFLMQLTSGYNRAVPLVNLTDFSTEDLVKKQNYLKKKVNRNYYSKHPIKYIFHFINRTSYLFKLLINNPLVFVKKIRNKYLGGIM